MNTMQIIEALCRIVTEALDVIRDEETKRQLEEEYDKVMGGQADE